MASDLRRLNQLLSTQEINVRNAFLAFLKDARSDWNLAQLATLLEEGRVAEALAFVDAHVVRLGNAIPEAFQQVGNAEAAALAGEVLAYSRMAITFDPTHWRAAELMRKSRLDFVQGFSELQRTASRQALARAFEAGLGPVATAKAFRDSIGLTPYQEQIIANYAAVLEDNSVESLERALRDQRFDRQVRASALNNRPLTRAVITRMVDRYRANWINHRAQTIARTEMQRTVNQARDESLRQTLDQAGVPPEEVEREWRATHDHRTRHSHAQMDRQVVGLNEAFTSGLGNALMFPGDPNGPAEDTINCRCVVITRIKQ